MAIEKELLDHLLGGRDPNEVFAKGGLLDDLKKAPSERILNAKWTRRGKDRFQSTPLGWQRPDAARAVRVAGYFRSGRSWPRTS
jgi:hypothetical protein